jgi:hypothetical protein
MKIEEFRGKLYLVPYTKTFSSATPEAQVICALPPSPPKKKEGEEKKAEQHISENVCKNASNF